MVQNGKWLAVGRGLDLEIARVGRGPLEGHRALARGGRLALGALAAERHGHGIGPRALHVLRAAFLRRNAVQVGLLGADAEDRKSVV